MPSSVSQTVHRSSALWCLANPISRDEPSLINISRNFSIFNFAKTILIRDKQTLWGRANFRTKAREMWKSELTVTVVFVSCYNLISMYGLDWTILRYPHDFHLIHHFPRYNSELREVLEPLFWETSIIQPDSRLQTPVSCCRGGGSSLCPQICPFTSRVESSSHQ